MRKILIIGSQGMAGHVVTQYFRTYTDWQIHTVSRSSQKEEGHYQFDIRDLKKLDEILSQSYEVVLNFVGILNHLAEASPEEAIFVNSYFPHYLAVKAKEFHHRVIHLSTDCVFSGSKGGYVEGDLKDATGYYAGSKALGEINYGNHLTCRTSILGPELKANGIGLFHWFSNQKGIINGYTNAIWTGVTTLELAKAMKVFIEHPVTGIYHLVNNEPISKFELLKLMRKYYTQSQVEEILPFDQYETNKSLVNTRSDLQYQVPSYDIMMDEMIALIEKKPTHYAHYLMNTFDGI